MACTNPIRGYVNAEGPGITLDVSKGFYDAPRYVPCKRCLHCRMAHARSLAIRCTHEASLYAKNCMVTFTYDPEHLPENQSLQPEDMQKCIKRIRRAGFEIRYFYCGEYGDQTKRPHYHLLCFNEDFRFDGEDLPGQKAHAAWTSPTLAKLWGKGFIHVTPITTASASYVARYTLKKQSAAEDETALFRNDGKVCWTVNPEFQFQSTKPGLGQKWIAANYKNVYPYGTVVVDGYEVATPLYYDLWLEKNDPIMFQWFRETRDNYRYEHLHSLESFQSRENRDFNLRARMAHKTRGN